MAIEKHIFRSCIFEKTFRRFRDKITGYNYFLVNLEFIKCLLLNESSVEFLISNRRFLFFHLVVLNIIRGM